MKMQRTITRNINALLTLYTSICNLTGKGSQIYEKFNGEGTIYYEMDTDSTRNSTIKGAF